MFSRASKCFGLNTFNKIFKSNADFRKKVSGMHYAMFFYLLLFKI